MLAMAQIFEDAGLPAGVLNVVCGSSSGSLMAPLIADPRLRKLSFTGSTAVGKQLIAQSAEQILRVSMELGGNAPLIVFDDADLDVALDGAMMAKMRNGGEACTSANRLLVQDSIAEEFAERLAERMGAMTVTRGTEADSQAGPLIDDVAVASVKELVDDAVAAGATALCGGAPIEGDGHFFAPTVLTNVPDDARILKEEIFGPVAPIRTFTTEQEAIAAANATEYGLVAYLFTRDIARGLRVIEGLETGMIGLNQGMVSNAGAPFGGVKQSGYGREGGHEGIDEYLSTKYVAINVAD
jgi:succinate-semialdehyde dehydrogenase/glutarate-semialdehyde dehydrogenase